MVTKWDSYRTVHFRNRHQNFFRATGGRLAGRSIERSKRYSLCFGPRAGCRNFQAFFQATLKTSRRFSIEIYYIERGQCCTPIYLTSTNQHAKKKTILVLNWNSESISKDTLLFERPLLTNTEARMCAFGAKMEAIFTPHSPQNCSTIRPFPNTTMWGPREKKKGADSRALLGPVVCPNSFSFGPQSTVIHSQVVGALQCPRDL